MTASIDEGSKIEEASSHARGDDDAGSWVETVITSLQTRSPEEKEALLKALLDGDRHIRGDLAHPSRSGRTIFPQDAEATRFSPSGEKPLPTGPLHDPHHDLGPTVEERSGKQDVGCS